MIGASAALHISHLPFLEPTGAVRIGRVNGKLVSMPTYQQLEESDLDLVVAGTKGAITMIEGFAREMPEADMLEAIAFSHEQIKLVVQAIEDLRHQAGLPAKVFPPAPPVNQYIAKIYDKHGEAFKAAKFTEGKAERAKAMMAQIDTDADGFVSAAEMEAMPMMGRMFDKMDDNADGTISKEEMDAVQTRMAEHRGQDRGHGKGHGMGHGKEAGGCGETHRQHQCAVAAGARVGGAGIVRRAEGTGGRAGSAGGAASTGAGRCGGRPGAAGLE
jgi:hypothetical protein